MDLTITVSIILLTVITSLAAFSNQQLISRLIFNPWTIANRKEWYRFITSGFIHADFWHLAINMLVLYSFGMAVEAKYHLVYGNLGTFYFIMLYAGGLIISVAPTYKKHRQNFAYNALGASGAVSAVLFANILFDPWDKIYLYGLIGIPGVLAGAAYLVYSHIADKKGGDNVNHDAHFWGAVFGFVFTIALKPSLYSYFINQLLHP